MIYREVIRDTVRVMPKHGERSGGDCRDNKQDFWVLEKLTYRPSDGIESTCRVNGRGWPISRGRSERYIKVFQFFFYTSLSFFLSFHNKTLIVLKTESHIL